MMASPDNSDAPSDMVDANADLTHGHLLDGRVRHAQPRRGFRSGIEPVLLAAAVPARPGSKVLEGGSGAGTTLLCLAARVPGVEGLGIDQDPALVALANQNAAANGWPTVRFLAADIATLPALGQFDHACANPPYHTAAGTPPSDALRRVAKHARIGSLAMWTAALARPLRQGGTLTFILPAALLPEAVTAFAESGCPPTAVLPLWPTAGQKAKLSLLRGVKGSRSPFRILPGLALHTPSGTFTEEAEAIFRGGAALEL